MDAQTTTRATSARYAGDDGFAAGVRQLLKGQIKIVRRALPDAMRAEKNGDTHYLRMTEAQHLRDTHALATMLPEVRS